MRMLLGTFAALLSALAIASAAEHHSCDIPDYLLFANNELKRVTVRGAKVGGSQAVAQRCLTIAGRCGIAGWLGTSSREPR